MNWFYFEHNAWGIPRPAAAAGMALFLLVGYLSSTLIGRLHTVGLLQVAANPPVLPSPALTEEGSAELPSTSKWTFLPFHWKDLIHKPHLLWFGLAVMLVVLKAGLFLAIWARFSDREQRSLETHQLLERIESMFSQLQTAETAQHAYLLTSRPDDLASYQGAVRSVPSRMDEVRRSIAKSKSEALGANRLPAVITETLAQMRDSIEARRQSGTTRATDIASGVRAERLMSEVRALTDNMRAEALDLYAQTSRRAFDTVRGMIVIMSAFVGLLLIVLVAGSRAIHVSIAERKLAQGALRASEERLQFATTAAGIGVWSWIPGTSHVVVTADWRRLFGIAPGVAVTFETWRDALHPDDSQRVVAELKASTEQRRDFNVEYRVCRPDGSIRWIADRGHGSYDESGNPVGVAGVNMDITGLKRAQAQAEEQRQTLDAFFAAAPGVLNLYDDQFRFLNSDPSTPGYFGLDRHTIVGQAIEQLDPSASADLLPLFRRVSESGQPELNMEIWRPVPQRAGEVACFRASLFPVPLSEGRVGLGAMALDITAQKRADQELGRQKLHYETLAENAPEIIARFDRDLRHVYINDYGATLYGRPKSEILGKTCEQLGFPAENSGFWNTRFEEVFATGKQQTVDFEYDSPTLGRRFFSALFVPEDYVGHPVTSVLEIARDITEQKRAEQELRDSEERFRTLFESMQEGFTLGEAVCNDAGEPVDFRFLEVNAALAGMFRRDRADIVGRTYCELFPVSASGHWVKRLGDVALTGNPVHFDDFGAATGRYYETAAYSPKPGQFAAVVNDISERKKIEQVLRESEEQFRTLANAIPQLCFMARADGSVLWYNERWFEYTGTTAEQAFGWGWQSLHDPDLLPQVLERWNESIATGKPLDMIFPLRGADGVFRPFLTRVMPVRGHDGNISRWFGTNTDISEQRRIEDALRDSESRMRTLGDNLPQGALYRYREDPGGQPHVDWMSAGIEAVTGIPASDFMNHGSVVSESIFPADLDRFNAAVASSREHLTRFEIEVRHIHRVTGEIHWSLLRSTPSRCPDGSTIWDGVDIEITDRKRVEEALRRSEHHYRMLFESMNEGLGLVELVAGEHGTARDARFISANPAFERQVGITTEACSGRTFREYFPEADPAVLEVCGRVALTGKPARLESWFDPFGRRFDIAVFSPEQGRCALLTTDVTERILAQESIRQLNADLENRVRSRTAQLEAANRELETFAYSVSHDLRAPLRGIDGWSLALYEDHASHLDPQAREYLHCLRSEAQRMGALIDALLHLSRIGREEMERDRVDLSGVAELVAGRLRVAHPGRNIRFDIYPGLTAFGDGRLLEIALTNLFGNSVKFTATRPEAHVEFGKLDSDEPAFYVRDNGVGFDMQYAAMLFGAFQRLHKASEFPGTGIGLATVQRIIHRHGGRMWAHAEPDRGATFYFTVPPEWP